ncbi:MAG: glycosyltransferase [Ignavibacteriales bacterium]|nr:MAG: glycosyltransferase [Ignavibacteriales bacterium]
MRSDNTGRYLKKYSSRLYNIESEINTCRYAVVIPSIAEYENIKKFLECFSRIDNFYFKDSLLLFVINNHQNSPPVVKEDNQQSLNLLRGMMKDPLFRETGIQIGIIDASTEGNELPEKDAGVGLARKTGMDAVLKMFPHEEKGIIICTDADCTFKRNYLTEIVNKFKENNVDAAVINFEHPLDDPDTVEAAVCYEIFLRYYVAGLNISLSPFAFHTIGSAMACSSDAYINVEGMNKRKAAEDFYFLEKLAKKYSILKINHTTVYPAARKSWRVPFGTGQRVTRFFSNKDMEYFIYDPKCFFNVLKLWHELFFNNDIFTAEEYLNSADKINANLGRFLRQQGFEKDWLNIIKNIKNTSGIIKQKIRWFDGFRTLKLVHFLRDTEYKLIPMFDALDELFLYTSGMVIHRDETIPDITLQTRYLKHLKELDK